MTQSYDLSFLQINNPSYNIKRRALIILNQPFSYPLLSLVWNATQIHFCADGGANRLYDLLDEQTRQRFKPDLIKGDLDSLRPGVHQYYLSKNVTVLQDEDQDTTDLMKCVAEVEKNGVDQQFEIIILGGLSGRLDQTIHTLSYVHKLRVKKVMAYVITDENLAWTLNSGVHEIPIDHTIMGPTCGLLPIGIKSTILTMSGLRWNLTNCVSSFDGMVSTSNQLDPKEKVVQVKTTEPIWWTVELRPSITKGAA